MYLISPHQKYYWITTYIRRYNFGSQLQETHPYLTRWLSPYLAELKMMKFLQT
jgi:hypothetical protein